MSIGIWQIAIVVILVVLLFGRGKISSLMGDVAKGIKSFKKGMASDVTDDIEPKNISDENKDTNNKTTNITTIAICQIPILIKTYNLFILNLKVTFYQSFSSSSRVLFNISSILE